MSEPETTDAIPYRFAGTQPAGQVSSSYGFLQPGEESGAQVSVAGRIMRHRLQGKVVFSELRDSSGSIQLFAQAGRTAGFEEFKHLSLGDWVGATGEVIRTRRGELSVRLERFTLLAHAQRGFGDKWRGVHDVEVRYRQREVDLWANEGVRETFLVRARLIANLRQRLEGRAFVEVETPVLQPIPGGAAARPFVTHYNALHAPFYLRVAPELYLKRLVIGGFERVFEFARVFRNEGFSPRHNPEFTMLEAYQAYADYLDMAELIESLVAGAAQDLLGDQSLEFQGVKLDLRPPWRRASMNEVIEEVTGEAASLEMGADGLHRLAKRLDVEVPEDAGAGRILLDIYEKTTEMHLLGPVHVLDYPEEVSPLTRRHRSRAGYVERLTPIIAGREIAEAYSELIDPLDQRARLVAQQAAKAAGDEEAMSLDEEFLRALEHGMPPTGGIGIGIDRLTMLFADKANIKEVLLFPALRPEGRTSDAQEPDAQAPRAEAGEA